MKLVKLHFIILIMICTNLWSENIEVRMMTYHTHAPFLINENEGLTFDLAEYLSEKTDYTFIVEPMSRLKLDTLLAENITAVIPWVNPAWLKDEEEIKYKWIKGSLMDDSISYISSMDSPLNFYGVNSLKNLTFGGLKGHNYRNIDDLVARGDLIRLDSDNHFENYRRLINHRIDFTITATSGAQYIIKKNGLSESLFISVDKDSIYNRRIMISGNDEKLKETMEKAIAYMLKDPEWISNTGKYK